VANVFTSFAVTRVIIDFLMSKKAITTLSI